MWFLLYFFAFLFSYTSAVTDEELKMAFTKIVIKCMKAHPVEMQELMKLQTYKIPTENQTKCLLACAYREEGSLNAKGLYDLDHAMKRAEMASNGDPKRLENGKKLAELCAKTNEEKVTDGEKGCDRATYIFKCITENVPKFGFKL